jgi:hypothetical protein
MVLNMCVRKRPLALWASLAGLLLLAACGESGYQYLESDDEHVFAKIPGDWEIMSEGVVDFALRPEDGSQFRLLPGDDVLPWRAQFTSDPSGRVDPDSPAGYVDVQPVDARMREGLSIERLLELGPGGETMSDPVPIVLGDLEGFRARYVTDGDDPVVGDRLVLTDDRHTVVYVVQVGCRETCFEANYDEIDEILRTFTVQT